ncbi:hypothetical protein ACFZBP_05085 [Streptomyces sp. NPDC008086]|uniref:hypothetical protein n=1 Tax=Streptomyces sp. NPDC008086 TaxID=3364807 RepID=UPI0036EDEB8B
MEAIFYEDDLPQRWAHYRSVNAEYFERSSLPEDEPGVGRRDHALVAGLPPQSSYKKDIAAFTIGKEDPADVGVWFPSSPGAE